MYHFIIYLLMTTVVVRVNWVPRWEVGQASGHTCDWFSRLRLVSDTVLWDCLDYPNWCGKTHSHWRRTDPWLVDPDLYKTERAEWALGCISWWLSALDCSYNVPTSLTFLLPWFPCRNACGIVNQTSPFTHKLLLSGNFITAKRKKSNYRQRLSL